MGNSEVKLRHKVQLRKKVEESQSVVEPEPSIAPAPIPEPESPKSNNWIWWIVAVIVLCVIGYFVFSKSDNEQSAPAETEVVEETVADDSGNQTDNPSEGVQDEANDQEAPEAAQTEQSAEVSEPEANASMQSIQSNAVESPSVTNDLEAEAMKVIRGDYGVGQERKSKLGSKYQSIQNRVNELKREGVF